MREKTLKEKTASGLLWGTICSLLTQVLGLVIGIFLGRLLSPGEYGMVGMLAIFSALAGTLQESGFRAALTNLKKVTHTEYNAVFWFSTTVSVSLYIILYFCAPLIADFYHQPELVELSRLTFASFVMAGIGTAHSAYMFRNMLNKEKAVGIFIALCISGAVGITMAWKGYSYWSLAWQNFTYITVCNICSLYYARWLPTLPVDMTPIKQMFGFSSKILLTNIITQVNNNILSLIFGRMFSSGDVGNYTQASKWSAMGHSLITGAFGLALIADFVPLVLGERWNDTVTLLRLLCISGAFMPLHSLYQNLFISNGRSDTYMWCTVAQVTLQIIVILAFGPYGIQAMVMAYSTMLILWLGIWQFIARRMVGIRFRDVLLDVCPFMLIALACVTVAWFATRGISSPVMSIASRIIVTATLYIGIMKLSGAKIFDDCVRFLLKKDKL